jgi:biotin--protein ligase
VIHDLEQTPQVASQDLSPDNFDVHGAFLPNLRSQQLGKLVMYSSTTPSTQVILNTKFKSVKDLVFIADTQSAGQGRGGNSWTSPMGCLMFSFKSHFTDGGTLPFVQYLVSLALVHAIKAVAQCDQIEVAIKWPNDIYVRMSQRNYERIY